MYNSLFMVALGGNLETEFGAADATILQALGAFSQESLQIRAVSRFFRSKAYPTGSSPDFVNACCIIAAPMTAQEVLEALHRIETRLGRVRETRWGARRIDLDLIAADQAIAPDEATLRHWIDLPLEQQLTETPDRLILPHPRLADRAFVLVPLAEIAPDWHHPLTGLSVRQMCDALPAQDRASLVPLDRPAA